MDPANGAVGGITIERANTSDLPPRTLAELRDLWADAYREDLRRYFEDIGPGVHFLARRDKELVSHAMWTERKLYPERLTPLKTAYVELVATRRAEQGRGFASVVMQRLADEIRPFALGALAPAVPPFYERLGWEMWRGPLFVRTGDGMQPTPEELVMVLRTPNTPGALDLEAPLAVDWRRGEVW